MLVFVDESGDSGMKGKDGSSAFFVITAVLFEENESAEECDRAINKVREECFPGRFAEFHFNKCSNAHRIRFLQAVAPMDFFYLSFVLDKTKLYGPGFSYKESFYKYTAKLLFENAKPYLKNATVTIDRSGNRDFRLQLEKYLKKKINVDDEIIRKIKTEPSHSNNLIQLADMVCGAIGRSYKPDKVDRMTYRKIIGHRELGVQLWPKV
jgi:hypothetical protein